jgi:hypothetical protein
VDNKDQPEPEIMPRAVRNDGPCRFLWYTILGGSKMSAVRKLLEASRRKNLEEIARHVLITEKRNKTLTRDFYAGSKKPFFRRNDEVWSYRKAFGWRRFFVVSVMLRVSIANHHSYLIREEKRADDSAFLITENELFLPEEVLGLRLRGVPANENILSDGVLLRNSVFQQQEEEDTYVCDESRKE